MIVQETFRLPGNVMSARSVLIVDDEREICRILGEFLAATGFEPMTADCVADAIRLLEEFRPEVVLLDLKMPGFRGDTLLRFIRQAELDMPVIIVSGHLTPDLVKDLLKDGANGFVSKPFQLDRVLAEIERVLTPLEEERGTAVQESDTARARLPDSQTELPDELTDRRTVPDVFDGAESLEPSSDMLETAGHEAKISQDLPPLEEDSPAPAARPGRQEAEHTGSKEARPAEPAQSPAGGAIRIDGNVGRLTGDIWNPETDFEIAGNISKGSYGIQGRNITVGGIVEEGTLIEATGDLQVKEGIIGTGRAASPAKTRAGRSWAGPGGKAWLDEVRVGGTLAAKFVRNRTKVVARNLHVDQDIAFSTVEVSGRGEAGHVVGGHLSVGEYFEASRLGAPGGTITSVELGADLGKRERVRDVEERIPIRERLLSDLKGRYDFRFVQRLQAERDRYIEMRRERGDPFPENSGVVKSLTEKIRQREAELDQLRVQIERTEVSLGHEMEVRGALLAEAEASDRAELVITGQVHPGVTVRMKGSTFTTNRELQGLRLYFKDGELVHESLSMQSLKLRRPSSRTS